MTTHAGNRPTRPDPAVSAATGADPHAARNRLVIGILIVSAFVVILNETIMSVALPTLMADLDISAASAQWLTTGFLLTMAVIIPITGFLLQRFHTRQIFLLAMILFTCGTLVAALAPGFAVLLIGRVVQASGTAIMLPLLMTTAMTLVAPAARGRTMGNISIVISVAPAIGPTISGVILSVLSWRFMFILVLPIAVAALVLGAAKIKNVTEPRKVPLDVLSVILSAFAFGGLLYGLSALGEGASHNPAPVPPLVPFAVGVGALVLFILRQGRLARISEPLLDLRAFRTGNFTISIAMIAASSITLFGSLIVLPIYMQSVLGLGTLTTGLLLLPGGLIMGILSPVVGRIYDRIGPTALLIGGSVLVSGSLWAMMAFFRQDTPVFVIPVIHVLLSIGLAMTFTPLFTSSLGSLEPRLYSHGSAILNTVQQVMGGAGTALFVTLLSTGTAAKLAQGAGGVEATAAGVQSAFLAGALISVLAVAAAFFVRKPAAAEGEVLPAGH
ncbi:DHA2 family efflux MFS transporter permease subunit [Arthrobacter caoxuetaonis]|uniref:DHA2 family efflux MFS transporter permease subunit n=1 Tax=Arthrobacter caoxuetaonis TaxID=2886935 RepID=A0A9X1ME15_9MICC|nr:DHA2 family efflux MFS transporter permease subunit [Arthrobacter caoxuetaonis]MCC3297049.1 DHA2 family efflux MFS transporter permease subunit [Arthrobacter caoxuetaonis]USQ58383.1 DHA2 family efflux MFS transporter permease subunit [Arthrobacter caoxuetaonis]